MLNPRACNTCGVEIATPQDEQKFCSSVCRKAGYRRRSARKEALGAPKRFRLYPGTGGRPKNAKFANRTNGEFCHLPSRFDVPLDILGGGYRWANRPPISPEVWEEILWKEGCGR
jgi:hypothetical protein